MYESCLLSIIWNRKKLNMFLPSGGKVGNTYPVTWMSQFTAMLPANSAINYKSSFAETRLKA
jgi:hypothetical protein